MTGGALLVRVMGGAPDVATVRTGALTPEATETCVLGTPPLATITTGGWFMAWLPVLAWLLRPWPSPPHQQQSHASRPGFSQSRLRSCVVPGRPSAFRVNGSAGRRRAWHWSRQWMLPYRDAWPQDRR